MVEPAVEIVNIGRVGQRRRRALGAAALVTATLVVLYLDVTHANRWLRLLVFPLMWAGILAWLEARTRTCVLRAGQGLCELDDGRLVAMDSRSRQSLSRRAKSLLKQSGVLAGALMLLALVFP